MNKSTHTFTLRPAGPFDLAAARARFGGWLTTPGDDAAAVVTFPVEGADAAAAVVLRQHADGLIAGELHGAPAALVERAWRQALATLSLDVDGTDWPAVGTRDAVIAELQQRYGCLRPVLFHSPYEAAASFVLGHRISIVQVRRLRARLAVALGTPVEVAGETFHAFPSPAQVLSGGELPGVPAAKVPRLRAIAAAALDGWLERDVLRAQPVDDALARLRTLPGVGPFFASGILLRGAGLTDHVADDEVTRSAIAARYGSADDAAVREITDDWAPFRTWASVLLHVWARSEAGLSARQRPAGTSASRARSSDSRSRPRATR
jgi:DNA-3-methyladenine glycosylase II